MDLYFPAAVLAKKRKLIVGGKALLAVKMRAGWKPGSENNPSSRCSLFDGNREIGYQVPGKLFSKKMIGYQEDEEPQPKRKKT